MYAALVGIVGDVLITHIFAGAIVDLLTWLLDGTNHSNDAAAALQKDAMSHSGLALSPSRCLLYSIPQTMAM